MDHSKSEPSHSNGKLRIISIALILTFVYMIVEAVGGWYSNSLALLADAGHMLTDVAALSLTLGAIWFGSRPATAKKTFGYYRLEILAAFVNGIVLVLLSIWIIYEAIQRWQQPVAIQGAEMSVVAFGGFLVNLVVAKMLHAGHSHDLNMRGAFLHVIGDLLGSVAAMIAGILIIFFGWVWADAATSILISLVIIYGAWRLIVESVNVLLEGTPAHIDLSRVETVILETQGVGGVHDLHVWTISSGIVALSAHISHHDAISHSDLLVSVKDNLHNHFGIDHLTIQMETMSNETEAVYLCETGTRCFEPARKS